MMYRSVPNPGFGNTSFVGLLKCFLLALTLAGCAQSPVGDNPQGQAEPQSGEKVYTAVEPIYHEPLTAEEQGRLDRALEAAGDDQWAEAGELLAGLQQARPDVPFVKVRLAWVRQQQGDNDEARRLYEQALAQDGSDVMAVNNLALLLQEEGEFQAARELLRKGLAQPGPAPELHYNLAVLSELYLLDLEAALTHYRAYQRAVEAQAASDATEPTGADAPSDAGGGTDAGAIASEARPEADARVEGWIADLERRLK